MRFDPWNGNPIYASLPLPGSGKRKGREYTKPFQQLSSRPFSDVQYPDIQIVLGQLTNCSIGTLFKCLMFNLYLLK